MHVLQESLQCPRPRTRAGICHFHDKLIIHGGHDGSTALSDVWIGVVRSATGISWQQVCLAHGIGRAMAGHTLMPCSVGSIIMTPPSATLLEPSQVEEHLWSLHLHEQNDTSMLLNARPYRVRHEMPAYVRCKLPSFLLGYAPAGHACDVVM